MIEYNRVFVDTTPLIYFLDDDVHFGDKSRQILEEILTGNADLVTSVITCTEYLVYPYRMGNQQKVEAFFEFLHECGVPVIAINTEIAQKAAEIRAKYKAFKAMDALQLAAAVYSKCDLFLTNDIQLKQYEELRCVTVEEWEM